MKPSPRTICLICLTIFVVGIIVRALWIADSKSTKAGLSLSFPHKNVYDMAQVEMPSHPSASESLAEDNPDELSQQNFDGGNAASIHGIAASRSRWPQTTPTNKLQRWESEVVTADDTNQLEMQRPNDRTVIFPQIEMDAVSIEAPVEIEALPIFHSEQQVADLVESFEPAPQPSQVPETSAALPVAELASFENSPINTSAGNHRIENNFFTADSGWGGSPELHPEAVASANSANPKPERIINLPTEVNSQAVVLEPSFDPSFDPLPKTSNISATSATEPAAPKSSAPPASNPSVLAGAEAFVLAAQPKLGDHWSDDRPQTDRCATLTETIEADFSPDAIDEYLPYDPYHQMHVYEGKTLNANQRPLLELGRPWYQLGQLSPGSTILGKHNPLTPQFLIYGDYRSAIASNTQQGSSVTQSAVELNLDFDLKLTSTERFHMFMAPLDNGKVNTGYLFDEHEYVEKFDANIDFGYFEGDLGAMVGGLTNKTLPFDFPFAIGVMPLLLQNGVWMEDAFLGVAATLPARNSSKFDISNMDTTFFAGYDKINSPAFGNDDSAARMYGIASFIEALNGYMEIDYAFLDDRTFDNRSYHNLGIGYTRRYGRFVSNSTRLIVNAGQESDVVANTADGVLLLSENSLITGSPSTVVPYLNLFAGFDRPQSAARAAQAGGILRNTGILFESDGMTNYPTLDPTANDTLGGAMGLNLLPDLSQQLVVEAAWLNVMGSEVNRNAAGNQYGLGMRYQLPLTNALIFRADGMVGFLDDASDVHGVRMELRHKW